MTSFLKYVLPVVLAVGWSRNYAQSGKPEIQIADVVHDLRKGGRYEEAFAPQETSSKQLDLGAKLRNIATDRELIQLTHHKSGVVRVYAFKALEERKYPGLYKIILEHVADKEKVDHLVYGYDLVSGYHGKQMVAEFFVSCDSLKPAERDLLDSILIFSKLELKYTDQLLSEIEPRPGLYGRIKELAQKSDYRFAVTALARYGKKEDLPILESRLRKDPYWAMEAVEISRDPYLKKVLTDIDSMGAKPYGFYNAVAVYRDSFAYKYLEKSLMEPGKKDYIREQKAKEIFGAVTKYKCGLYNELFFQLWQMDFMINDSVFAYLAQTDPQRCARIALQTLKEPDKFDNSTLVIEEILNFITSFDSAGARSVVLFNIQNAGVDKFSIFSEQARYFKHQDVINALFTRLEATDNPHIYVPVTETLLFFKDKEVNGRLLNSLHANKNVKDWGREKVVELLNEYNLKL